MPTGEETPQERPKDEACTNKREDRTKAIPTWIWTTSPIKLFQIPVEGSLQMSTTIPRRTIKQPRLPAEITILRDDPQR